MTARWVTTPRKPPLVEKTQRLLDLFSQLAKAQIERDLKGVLDLARLRGLITEEQKQKLLQPTEKK